MLLLSGTVLDDDQDAIYLAQYGVRSSFAGTSWTLGYEVVGGALYSHRRDRTGAVAGWQAVLTHPLFKVGPVRTDFYASTGWQMQSMAFPGESYHNFRHGFGLEVRIGTTHPWLLRAAYTHLSNGNLGPLNEGLDALWLAAGRAW